MYNRIIKNEKRGDYMLDYEDTYKCYLTWLTLHELLKEFVYLIWHPWRYRERKWIKEEIESRCVY